MTFRRSLLAGVALFAAGCAFLPGTAADDVCKTGSDASCGIIQGDGSADAALDVFATPLDAGAPNSFTRSQLCSGPCSPDDPAACIEDGGAADGATLEDQSCRVTLGVNQQQSTSCVKAGQGDQGASCTSGADCAPGYECVGTGTCRRYCCDESTCTVLTNSSPYETYFCDVASEHANLGAIVPVCTAVAKCQPFGTTNTCAAGQSCTIIEVDSTSLIATCVELGDAKLGDSCEAAHCGLGLACIGAIGQRTCQELCDPQHPCPNNLTCNQKSQALMQYKVGICGT